MIEETVRKHLAGELDVPGVYGAAGEAAGSFLF